MWLLLLIALSTTVWIPSVGAQAADVATIKSFQIVPSRRDGQWTIYRKGAVAKVTGRNLRNVEIMIISTGTEMGKGGVLGTAKQTWRNTWVFPMPSDLSAVHVWVEAKDGQGRKIKGPDLGNVGSE